MRKGFKYYSIIWLIVFVLFNIAIFAIPATIDGKTLVQIAGICSAISKGASDTLLVLANSLTTPDKTYIINKYAGAFWPSYIFVLVSFIGQLVCAYLAFKEKDNTKFLYRIPLIRISYIGLIVTVIAGLVGMFVLNFPIFISVIICVLVMAIEAIQLFKALHAIEIVEDIDNKVKTNTMFVKLLEVDAKELLNNASSENKEALNRLFEAIRYATPISNEIVSQDEYRIKDKFNELKNIISKNEDINNIVDEIISILKTRNEKLKMFK